MEHLVVGEILADADERHRALQRLEHHATLDGVAERGQMGGD